MIPIVFKPDVIIEATTVCDRACRGCYAPNTINLKTNLKEFYDSHPHLFLDQNKLITSLYKITETGQTIDQIAIRGGEPTQHPYIAQIISIARYFSREVFLETHGRWLENYIEDDHYLRIKRLHEMEYFTAKLSFDKMHKTSVNQLYFMTQILKTYEEKRTDYLVAITENNHSDFLKTRSLCPLIPDNKIIFQKKAYKNEDLIRPQYGVVNVSGELVSDLNSKFSSTSAQMAL